MTYQLQITASHLYRTAYVMAETTGYIVLDEWTHNLIRNLPLLDYDEKTIAAAEYIQQQVQLELASPSTDNNFSQDMLSKSVTSQLDELMISEAEFDAEEATIQ